MRSNSPPISRRSPELVSPYINIPNNINTYEFDAYLIDECFVLKNVAGHIFKEAIESLGISFNTTHLNTFIHFICEKYNNNSFHNFQHAVNVLQMTYKLLKDTGVLYNILPHIAIATLIAALSHDVDHPGNTNSYEINSMSKYARLYNDNSVLENHHCSLTFDIIEQSELHKCFAENLFKQVRKTIIACILGTDMSKHSEHLMNFANIDFETTQFDIEEQYIIVSAFVHFADLSNSVKPFEISMEWSKRISCEFYNQYIKEETEGLPCMSFMKVQNNYSICLNEIHFMTCISVPTWQAFAKKFNYMQLLVDSTCKNLNKWKLLESKYLAENDINSLIH